MATSSFYNYGSASATEFTTLPELLSQLPDNSGNLIEPVHIRNSVYTLWQLVGSVSASASATVSVTYDRASQSTNVSAVGGVNLGSTFSGTVQDVLDQIFYPYLGPTSSLIVGGGSTREFGQALTTSLLWSVTKYTNPITSITVGGISQSPSGNSQTGVQSVTATYSFPPSATASSQFSVVVSDGSTTTTSTQSIVWYHRIFWGSVALGSFPNLTTNPGSASLFLSVLGDSAVRNLDGADANGLAYGTLLSGTKNNTYLGINGSSNTPGEYLVFAWPSNFSGAYTPTFKVNGMINNAFSRIRNNSPLVANVSLGYSTNYEVWVSNTRYFSPVNVEIS